MKSEFAIFQFFRRLSQLAYFVKCMRTLLKLNSYRNISKFRNRKKFYLRLFLSSIKLTVKLVQKMSCTCKVFLLLILKTASSVLSSCLTMSIPEYVGDHCLPQIEVRKYFNTYLLFVIKVVLYMLSARVLKQNFK